MDPLAGSSWSAPSTVTGFSQSPPNETLLAFAAHEHARARGHVALDIGCGAARNTAPLVAAGWEVVGTDLSWPMLQAAAARLEAEGADADRERRPHAGHGLFALAPMEALPVRDASVDLVIAHGIWNLARSGAEFRAGVREAARVAKRGAALFVFTFSRHTLPPDVQPVPDESFVFTEFSGAPQCFLTGEQLLSELRTAGFASDPGVPLRELNRPQPGALQAGRAPVIYEAAFRRVAP
jgi:SAM-dependent methyltransferase